jgi:hypothetical protein
VVAILLEREAKLAQTIAARGAGSEKQEDGAAAKVEEVLPGEANLMREIKKNRLGGIHLFN